MAKRAGTNRLFTFSMAGSELAEFYADSILRQEDSQILMTTQFVHLKKSGQEPPTAPALRPRVLTPRDHFVHRGGERSRIMQQSD
jgi:hypothetical protein